MSTPAFEMKKQFLKIYFRLPADTDDILFMEKTPDMNQDMIEAKLRKVEETHEKYQKLCVEICELLNKYFPVDVRQSTRGWQPREHSTNQPYYIRCVLNGMQNYSEDGVVAESVLPRALLKYIQNYFSKKPEAKLDYIISDRAKFINWLKSLEKAKVTPLTQKT